MSTLHVRKRQCNYCLGSNFKCVLSAVTTTRVMATLSTTYIRRLVLRLGRLGGGAGKHWTLLTESSNHHLDEGGEVTAALEGRGEGGEGRRLDKVWI